MSSSFHRILDAIEAEVDHLTDMEYKTLVECVGALHRNRHGEILQPVRGYSYPLDEDSHDDPYITFVLGDRVRFRRRFCRRGFRDVDIPVGTEGVVVEDSILAEDAVAVKCPYEDIQYVEPYHLELID